MLVVFCILYAYVSFGVTRCTIDQMDTKSRDDGPTSVQLVDAVALLDVLEVTPKWSCYGYWPCGIRYS